MLHQGKLKNWDPTKGTGFLQQEKAGPDIRISSCGFRQKPDQLQDGDSIFFQIEVDALDQPKAVLAYKAGQRFAPASSLKKPAISSLPVQHLLSVLVTLSVLAWLGYQSAYLFSADPSLQDQVYSVETEAISAQSEAVLAENLVVSAIQSEQSQQFQCEGKQHCSEMRNCDEAKFYLKNCPDVLIDGDNDGIPCEQQHCGYRRF